MKFPPDNTLSPATEERGRSRSTQALPVKATNLQPEMSPMKPYASLFILRGIVLGTWIILQACHHRLIAAEHPVPDSPLWLTYSGDSGPGVGKHIVLIAADQEYRSEYSMPMLARLLAKRHGFHCTVLFSLNQDNEVDPTQKIYKDGGRLPAGCLPLVDGQPLTGRNHDDAVNAELIPLPVAWVRTWVGNTGQAARIFHVTMGSAQDFQSEGLRRLTVNATFWCLKMEDDIIEQSSMELVGEYNPPDSGFAYKKLNIVPRIPSFYK